MHLNPLLDVDDLAAQTPDELSILLELQAPQSEGHATRPPRTLQVVLDRSGSMGGAPLDAAMRALHDLVGRLDPQDRFGLVTFDDAVRIDVPCAPVGDGLAARHAIAAVHTGGMTSLSSGLIRGIEQARDAKGDHGATVLLLSDGHANAGETGHDALRTFAAGARRYGIGLSTVGIGLGYVVALLAAIAAGGAGDAHFAEDPDGIGQAIGAEVDGLLDQVVQAVSLTVRPGDAMTSVALFNDLPVSPLPDGFVVELGDFSSGEARPLLLRAVVPQLADLGLAEVCRLTLRWTDLGTMTTQTVDVPVHVNVVPGDAAAGRIPRPEVRKEVVYQEAQKHRRDAAEAARHGDRDASVQYLRNAGDALIDAADGLPAPMASELYAEAEELHRNAAETAFEDLARSAKNQQALHHARTQKRRAVRDLQERELRASRRGRPGAGADGEPGEGKFG
jgi:Ca-activated chloride channel family protein